MKQVCISVDPVTDINVPGSHARGLDLANREVAEIQNRKEESQRRNEGLNLKKKNYNNKNKHKSQAALVTAGVRVLTAGGTSACIVFQKEKKFRAPTAPALDSPTIYLQQARA